MRLPLLFLLFMLSSLFAGPANSADKLTVLLDWFVNPDHAALVIARERGMFSDAGLDVDLVAPSDPSAPPRLVAAGQADLAITYQPQLHVQAAEGLKLARVATLIETPLNALAALRDGPVKSIADLKGKTVGFSVGGFEDALLAAMLKREGMSIDDIELVNVNFALSPSLISGKVDAVIGAFRNFEMNQLDIEGHPGIAFFPEENGVPVYDELVVVARRDEVGDPRISKFLDAIEAATLWTTNHPDEAWKVFATSGPDLDNELNKRAWRDTLPRLAKRPAALDRRRYERFAEFMKDAGMITEIPPLDSYAVEVK
jgi:putative hydroxymethylpyrimidine transport system substrate-binding protein